MLSDQHIVRFQGWLSLMGRDLGHLPSRSWLWKTQESGCPQAGEEILSFQMTHCTVGRLGSLIVGSMGAPDKPALSPLPSTCTIFSKLLIFSKFVSSSGKWDKQEQHSVTKLVRKLSSGPDGM